jgi:arachidonate 15-lipoxygenase
MGTIRISGRVIYGQPVGIPVGVAGAAIRIIDEDKGGNGNDTIFVGTTDSQGNFDGMSSEWVDANNVTQRVWVPGRYEGLPPRWVDGHHENVTVPVPDLLSMRIIIKHEGDTKEYGYAQVPGRALVITPWTAPPFTLPSNDPNPVARTAKLVVRREIYRWKRSADAPLPYVDGHPPQELPPPSYVQQRSAVEAAIRQRHAENSVAMTANPIDSLVEYPRITAGFGSTATPTAIDNDAEFARQRVAGVNPLVIERWQSQPQACLFSDAHLASHNLSIQQAATQGRLFLCDYALLQGAPTAAGRHFYAPFALFLAMPAGPNRPPELAPVAIQIERGVSGAGVFVPTDGENWRKAKAIVQMADLNVHELKSHLFECHLVMETLAVAAARQMAPNHPIYELLRAHFNLLVHQNVAARTVLVNPGGEVDRLLGTGIKGAREILTRTRQGWTFRGAALRTSLERRGIATQASTQLAYPYRDDALLIWDTISAHVTRWVGLYYTNDQMVQSDPELQGWRNHAIDPTNGGNVGELPALDGRQALADVLTQIVFTCTAQHSAVNYSQYEFLGSVLNMPASVRADFKATGIELFHMLPDDALANDQFKLAAELTMYQYDQLGDYPTYNDAALQRVVNQFKSSLFGVMQTINARNLQRTRPYLRLLPQRIANSVSI